MKSEDGGKKGKKRRGYGEDLEKKGEKV